MNGRASTNLLKGQNETSKQMTLNAELPFDTFGKEFGLFGVGFGSLVT